MGAFATTSLDEKAAAPEAIADGFARALDAARQFEGATAPNPPVGCVLLDVRGDVIAIGAHEMAGLPHAEADAISKANAIGRHNDIHTVIVTLEPCNHTGRTPPCSKAIVNTPAKHVWLGVMDPNPKVVGGGAKYLADAGLDVRTFADLETFKANEFSDDATRLIAPFAKHHITGLPFVTVKQAINRDGNMVPPKGQKTFTSQSSLELAHRLRKRAGAVLTGSGTILADNPTFTVRHVDDFSHTKRHLMILDRRRRVSSAYISEAIRNGFAVSTVDTIEQAIAQLGAAGVHEVLVEAGPSITAAIFESGLWDEHVLITQQSDGMPDAVEIRCNPSAAWLRSA